jgi:hypothetical protein
LPTKQTKYRTKKGAANKSCIDIGRLKDHLESLSLQYIIQEDDIVGQLPSYHSYHSLVYCYCYIVRLLDLRAVMGQGVSSV